MALDVVLRSLWLEQIQNIIHYLHQESENIKSNFHFSNDFNMPNKLAMLINDLMREQAYQVKKCATTSLLLIVEKQLLDLSRLTWKFLIDVAQIRLQSSH